MSIIIDGHNLFWAIAEIGKDSEPISDVQLCRIISRYMQNVGEDGEIVFDGIGPPDKTGFENLTKLEVIFTGRATDADTLIENKIKANTSPRRLAVVSSDRRLRKAAQVRKATSVKSELFWRELKKRLSQKQATAEPEGKRHGLTGGETKQWLEFFGLEQ